MRTVRVVFAMLWVQMLDRPKTKPRLSIELNPEDEALVRQAHADAVLHGTTLRQWLLDAMRRRLDEQSSAHYRPNQ